MGANFTIILGLMTLLSVLAFFHNIYRLLFKSKIARWLILFYLLFSWQMIFIGIDTIQSILFSMVFTIVCAVFNNDSKYHKLSVSLLLVVLIGKIGLYYIGLIYSQFNMLGVFL